MNITLEYGKRGLGVNLDSQWVVSMIKKSTMPVMKNPILEFSQSLENGINSEALESEARGMRSACILVCDVTRPVPNNLLLGPILKKILNAGVPKENIVILVATGLHRPNLGKELESLIGDPWVLENFNIENHYAGQDDQHLEIGMTSRGILIKLDRRFVEADLKIATGLVEPHFMAGYSGGRKVVIPGIAHESTIRTLHSSRFMSDPYAENCVLLHNPLHEQQLEVIAMLGRVLAVNVVLDDGRRVSHVNFGEVVSSHLEAVRFVERFAKLKADRQYETIITSAAGYPLDQTFYQTIKGMVGPLGILKQGGDLIIVAECSEGLGSEGFRLAQKRMLDVGGVKFLKELSLKQHADIDEWQTQMQLKATQASTVHLYTDGLTENEKRLTGVNVINSVEEKLGDLILKKEDKSIAIIPEGPYLVPVYEPKI